MKVSAWAVRILNGDKNDHPIIGITNQGWDVWPIVARMQGIDIDRLMNGSYISRIEIKAMWGRKHIVWNLLPDVNILSGVNGAGKSTILNMVAEQLDALSEGTAVNSSDQNVSFVFSPEDADMVTYDVIRSIDRPLMHSNLLEKMADKNVVTELDWQIYRLQRRYLDYQVNIGNRTIQYLTSGNADLVEKAAGLSRPKMHFLNLIDELFSDSGKTIVRDSNDLQFDRFGIRLLPYDLSSGEKQLLVVLLTALVQDSKPGVILMDEPEVSLDIDWQQQLIQRIIEINPNVQIILTTHSPAVIMNGWMDNVTDVADITVE